MLKGNVVINSDDNSISIVLKINNDYKNNLIVLKDKEVIDKFENIGLLNSVKNFHDMQKKHFKKVKKFITKEDIILISK